MIKYTLDKLALVSVMVVDPAVQAQALTQSVGEEITRMIGEQKELESRFEQLIGEQHVLRTMPNKSKLQNNQVWRWLGSNNVFSFSCNSFGA